MNRFRSARAGRSEQNFRTTAHGVKSQTVFIGFNLFSFQSCDELMKKEMKNERKENELKSL